MLFSHGFEWINFYAHALRLKHIVCQPFSFRGEFPFNRHLCVNKVERISV